MTILEFSSFSASLSKRAIISVTNDLRTDQRVDRICHALVELGYEILLIGRAHAKDAAPMVKLESRIKTRRLRMLFTSGILYYAEFNLRWCGTLLGERNDL